MTSGDPSAKARSAGRIMTSSWTAQAHGLIAERRSAPLRLFSVVRGTIRVGQHPFVFRCQLRRLDGDRELVELSGESKRDLVIAVVHRRPGFRADVECLIDWKHQRNRALHLLGRYDLAIDGQRASTAPTDAAHVVEGKGC